MNDFFPLFIALLFVIVAFVTAMNNGVIKLLSSGLAAAASLAVFFVLIHTLPSFGDALMGIELTWKPLIGIASLAAAVVYVVSRLILGFVFKKIFNHDSPFSELVDGIPGGIISFLPSIVVVFFLFCCVRIAGTVQELNYTATLSQQGIRQLGGRMPNYPFSAGWRNGIESVPLVAPVLDLVDPFSNRSNRNTAALVMAKGSAVFGRFVTNQVETSELIENPEIVALTEVPDVSKALEKQDRVGLVMSNELRKVAASSELKDDLARMDLRQVLEDFVKSLEPEKITIPKI